MYFFNLHNLLSKISIIIIFLLINMIMMPIDSLSQETKPIHRETPPKNSSERQKRLLRTSVQKETNSERSLRQASADGVIQKSRPKNKAAQDLVKPVKIIDRKNMASAQDLINPEAVKNKTVISQELMQKVLVRKKTSLSTDLINPVKATDNKKFEGTSYSGDYEAPKPKQNPQSEYSGNISLAKLNKKAKAVDKKRDQMKAFSGSLLVSDIRKKQRRNEQMREQMATFSGDMVVTNTKSVQRKRAKQISSFKGNVLIKQRPPKAKNRNVNYSSPLRNRVPANYNRNRLKAGAKLKKSELPNYQKNQPKKIGYDAREGEFLRTGGSLKEKGFARPERPLPKPVKKKKKGKSTGEDGEQKPPEMEEEKKE